MPSGLAQASTSRKNTAICSHPLAVMTSSKPLRAQQRIEQIDGYSQRNNACQYIFHRNPPVFTKLHHRPGYSEKYQRNQNKNDIEHIVTCYKLAQPDDRYARTASAGAP